MHGRFSNIGGTRAWAAPQVFAYGFDYYKLTYYA